MPRPNFIIWYWILNMTEKNIVPGSLLTKGAVIDIVLGSGNGRNTVVLPQLTGKNLQEALDILRKSYLNLGEVLPDASIKSKKRCLLGCHLRTGSFGRDDSRRR